MSQNELNNLFERQRQRSLMNSVKITRSNTIDHGILEEEDLMRRKSMAMIQEAVVSIEKEQVHKSHEQLAVDVAVRKLKKVHKVTKSSSIKRFLSLSFFPIYGKFS